MGLTAKERKLGNVNRKGNRVVRGKRAGPSKDSMSRTLHRNGG